MGVQVRQIAPLGYLKMVIHCTLLNHSVRFFCVFVLRKSGRQNLWRLALGRTAVRWTRDPAQTYGRNCVLCRTRGITLFAFNGCIHSFWACSTAPLSPAKITSQTAVAVVLTLRAPLGCWVGRVTCAGTSTRLRAPVLNLLLGASPQWRARGWRRLVRSALSKWSTQHNKVQGSAK